jgi:peptide/nickel transport system substrate-binding protein
MIRRWLAAMVAVGMNVLAGPTWAQSTLRMALTTDASGLGLAGSPQPAHLHGFLVHDQLFALDSAGHARPQMVETHQTSADGLEHRITLRDGLFFHDGQAVRAADAVASIDRWMRYTQNAQPLASATAALDIVDEQTFTIRLSRPFALVAELLANRTASAVFIRPERVERRPPGAGLNDTIGSGPFMVSPQDMPTGRRPAASRSAQPRLTYLRNPNYRPRSDAPDGLAGGKHALLDRVELLAFAVPADAVAALRAGEVDVIEQVPLDQVRVLEQDRHIRMLELNPAGFMIQLHFNHAQSPFDRVEARQALLHIIDQQEVGRAIGVRTSEQIPYCPAFYFCGTRWESSRGAQGLRDVNVDRARELLRAAGYSGQPVVLINSADISVVNATAQVLVENFRRAGLNVDLRNHNWVTAMQHRSRRGPVDQDGWSLAIELAQSINQDSPLNNLRLGCAFRLPDRLCDQPMEDQRRAWWEESDPVARQEILHRLHARAYEVLPYIIAAQFRTLTAHRTDIEGLRATTVPVFWGVTKR